jgi:hypothetical protein
MEENDSKMNSEELKPTVPWQSVLDKFVSAVSDDDYDWTKFDRRWKPNMNLWNHSRAKRTKSLEKSEQPYKWTKSDWEFAQVIWANKPSLQPSKSEVWRLRILIYGRYYLEYLAWKKIQL